jgi:hypothetical protein
MVVGLAACRASLPSSLPPTIQAALVWTIGGADTGPASFSDFRALAVDAHRRLYVLEAREREVRVFDSAGRFMCAIGRAGRGPGEFTEPNCLAMGPADRLHVDDPRARTGEWISRVALPIVPIPHLHMAISGSDLYAVTADSLDVPAVHRLTVSLPD